MFWPILGGGGFILILYSWPAARGGGGGEWGRGRAEKLNLMGMLTRWLLCPLRI